MSPNNYWSGVTLPLIAAVSILVATPSDAAITGYSQDFESLNQADSSSLANDGWLVGGNVFDPSGTTFLYNYFAFPAPNGGQAFSGIDIGQGGPDQGAQQLVVYNDYANADHNIGNRIEANVYQEQVVGAGDVGSTVSFSFDAKQGNIEGASTAAGFIKTVDPNAGHSLTNFVIIDMTSIGILWGSYELSLFIDSSLDGQLIQFGFLNVASNFEGSGIFYDNVNFRVVPVPGAIWLFASAFGVLAAARRKR